ncbi:MAG: chorismate-binding protein [Oscillospiraceae bacterium]|jgi:anthranilate synthase component 1|nr:chorismate-binding protein [Oscillospiraceae bacterium]
MPQQNAKIQSFYPSQGENLAVFTKTFPLSALDPLEVFLRLKARSPHAFILDSAEMSARGRWTFCGYAPRLEITARGEELTITENGSARRIKTLEPNAEIRKILAAHIAPKAKELPPFSGGLVGYFAYDSVQYTETALHITAADEEAFNDIDLMLFDRVIAFDHAEDKLLLIVNLPFSPDSPKDAPQEALDAFSEMEEAVFSRETPPSEPFRLESEFNSLFSERQYCEMVETAKKHIYEGDIFQVVLSNRLDAKASGSLFEVYRTLRGTNPSPYMFYFAGSRQEIAGAAPETLIRLTNGKLFTYPLAGTRPRGATPEEDDELERGLLSDEKELSEHNMLVDLGRNDIGKISEFGSVAVEEYLKVLRFSHVMHIGSTVTGSLAEGLDALDAISAILPAGTLSGAPKLRAMQIIDKLEGSRRALYGGGIGYIGFNGDADTCIAIRLAFMKNGRVYIRAGAGIVADSVPETEFAESNNKMRAVVDAVEKVSAAHAPVGLPRREVRLEKHNPAWEVLAADTIAKLKTIFGAAAVDIQHVGSTAVRGIAAKPIIDIAAAVDDLGIAEQLAAKLNAAGFYKSKLHKIPGDILFADGGESSEVRSLHIHIVQADGERWRNYLLFRDYLNANPAEAKAYERVKKNLAEEYPGDRNAYTEGKNEKVREILKKAREAKL